MMQKQSQIPLEKMFASGLAAALLRVPAMSKGNPVPFELCGIEYAHPSQGMYIVAFTFSIIAFTNSVISTLIRCFAVWHRRDHENRTAHLLPGFLTGIHGYPCVVYARRWQWILPSLSPFIGFQGFILFFVNDSTLRILPFPLAFGSFLVFHALNIFLVIAKVLVPKESGSHTHKFIDMLSVLVTDKEYDAPEFQRDVFRPISVCGAPSIRIAEVINNPHAIIDVENGGTSLYIRTDKNYGSLRTINSWRDWFVFSPQRIHEAKLFRIEQKYQNFGFIPCRVPYSIMWYSIYTWLEEIDSFQCAADIDKCLIWLSLVSILTELTIRCIPGPCVAIKTRTIDENESQFVSDTSDSSE